MNRMNSRLYPKVSVFVNVSIVCVLILAILYLFHSVFATCLLGYGHYGQAIGGYLLVGSNYYKAVDTSTDNIGDEEELELINERETV